MSLNALKRSQAALNKAQEAADAKAKTRDRHLLAAADNGAKRADLEQATGLSQARVTQLLRRAREERATAEQ